MEEAYVYCIPLDEVSVKIGSHLGSLHKLDARYGTSINRERLAQKSYFRVEQAYRIHVERVIQLFLKRIDNGALFVEKEKFKVEAVPVFKSYAPLFELKIQAIEETPNIEVPSNEEAQEMADVMKRLKIAQHEKRVLRLKRLEDEKLEAAAKEKREKAEALRDDPYIQFRQTYIVVDKGGAISWPILRETFKKWYSQTYGITLTGRCDNIKKYFVSKLGPFKVISHKNDKFDGTRGFSLVELPVDTT